MAYLSQYEYYTNNQVNPTDKNWGSYQYISLYDLVNNYMLMYTGNHSLINNTERYKVLFHAKRAIQELNYDAFKELKVLELTVDDELRFVLPSDYVNWVRISLYKDGYLRPLTENIQILSANTYLQSNTGAILFDINGNVLEPQHSKIVKDRLDGRKKDIYLNPMSPLNGSQGWCLEGDWYFEASYGERYGLNTETANFNPTFKVDKRSGVINFNSDMHGELCILEYISDGMEGGDDNLVSVNKLFESVIYAYIEYQLLDSKLNVQEYVINRAKKKYYSLLRNAKIRIGNINPARLLMNLRGLDKVLK